MCVYYEVLHVHSSTVKLHCSSRLIFITETLSSISTLSPKYYYSLFLDIPSNVWLDSSLHEVVQEHSYASLPLPKKRKVSATGTTAANNNTNNIHQLLEPHPLNHSLLSKCVLLIFLYVYVYNDMVYLLFLFLLF